MLSARGPPADCYLHSVCSSMHWPLLSKQQALPGDTLSRQHEHRVVPKTENNTGQRRGRVGFGRRLYSVRAGRFLDWQAMACRGGQKVEWHRGMVNTIHQSCHALGLLLLMAGPWSAKSGGKSICCYRCRRRCRLAGGGGGANAPTACAAAGGGASAAAAAFMSGKRLRRTGSAGEGRKECSRLQVRS